MRKNGELWRTRGQGQAALRCSADALLTRCEAGATPFTAHPHNWQALALRCSRGGVAGGGRTAIARPGMTVASSVKRCVSSGKKEARQSVGGLDPNARQTCSAFPRPNQRESRIASRPSQYFSICSCTPLKTACRSLPSYAEARTWGQWCPTCSQQGRC